MSWNGFKKAVNRAGAGIQVKAQDKTVDKSFDIDDRRYQVLRKAGTALQKALKDYLDGIRAVTVAQVSIADIVSQLSTLISQAGQVYLDTMRSFDLDRDAQIDTPFRETVLDPVTQFTNYFTEVDAAIKKRNHKKTDYELCKAKVRKLIDKPPKDAGKLPTAEKELALAKTIYEELNEQLKQELPQFIALRVPYYDPSFEACIKVHKRFCTELYARLAQIQQYLPPETRDQYANGELDTQIDDMIVNMNSLNIATLGR